MMENLTDRSVYFIEAFVLKKKTQKILEIETKSPRGEIKTSPSKNYKEGGWLLSLWYVPHLDKDFLELTPQEIEQQETTWQELYREAEKIFG